MQYYCVDLPSIEIKINIFIWTFVDSFDTAMVGIRATYNEEPNDPA